jgi:PncC family amidohydrolase
LNADGADQVVADLHLALGRRGATLATAESLTGGGLASRLTSVAGASAVYVGGVVAYATEIKVCLLGVSTATVETDGVISAACAKEMAQGVRRLLGATYALSTTGVAGPDEQEGHRPGTVYVAVATSTSCEALALELVGDREVIQRASVDAALNLLGRVLVRDDPGLG